MIVRDDYVLGLDVAVDDSPRVRVAQRFAYVPDDSCCVLNGKLAGAGQPRSKVLTLDERHREVEQRTFRGRGEERNDVRMVQPRSHLDLAPESLDVHRRGNRRR